MLINQNEIIVKNIVMDFLLSHKPFTMNDIYQEIINQEGRINYSFQLRTELLLEQLLNIGKLEFNPETLTYTKVSKRPEFTEREIKRNKKKLLSSLESAKDCLNIDEKVCDEIIKSINNSTKR